MKLFKIRHYSVRINKTGMPNCYFVSVLNEVTEEVYGDYCTSLHSAIRGLREGLRQ